MKMAVIQMNELTYRDLEEKVIEKKLDNGLQVYLIPKPEVTKSYGLFMTDYGSVHRSFIPIGKTEEITVPDGIAHFLEHKLFEKEDRDVFADFLKNGASPNAYTSFTKTAYLFSTTKLVKENVEILLDFVQDPYFSEASVEKEKGIIEQEIKMYDDQADWQAFTGTIRNMFHNHPVQIDIAGTVDSIQDITKDDLYTCYNTFYHPENMTLCVIGAFDEQEMMQLIEDNQQAKTFPTFTNVEKHFPNEPVGVKEKESTLQLPVSTPKVTVGIKEAAYSLSKEEFLRRDVYQDMLLDYFFSPSGQFYEQLYQEELIDDSFEYTTNVEKSFSFSLISSNTAHPEQLKTRIFDQLLQISQLEITEEELDVMKKKYIGQLLRVMNSLEFIANQYIYYHFMELDFFTINEFVQNITLDEINEFMQEWIIEDKLTACIITQPE